MGYLPVVVDAVYMGDYRIKLEFDNGEKRLVDCEPWLKGDIFQPLKDDTVRKTAKVVDS
jgi:uncharacterized protein DUF2442